MTQKRKKWRDKKQYKANAREGEIKTEEKKLINKI